jgi:hypothetical protein
MADVTAHRSQSAPTLICVIVTQPPRQRAGLTFHSAARQTPALAISLDRCDSFHLGIHAGE